MFRLRSRLMLALVATAAVTLLAAALSLFSPLQDRLRSQQSQGLKAAARTGEPQVADALRKDLREGGRLGDGTRRVLGALTSRTGAQVLLTDGAGSPIYGVPTAEDDVQDVLRVLGANGADVSRRGDLQRIALPVRVRPPNVSPSAVQPFFVLALRKQDTDVAITLDEVRKAFLTAAVIGLAAAILFGLVLATTLTRRLERLRQSALRLTSDGMDAPAPKDDAADEVGDLARAMTSMRSALLRQEEARRAFVATASHELRTPLTSLGGNLELLEEDLGDSNFDREQGRIQVIAARQEIGRLRNLASELLELSRLDAQVKLRSEPVELEEVARAVAAEFALRAHAEQTLLEIIPARGPCWVRGDPDAIARVTRILIDNALLYSPQGSAIRIAAAYHGQTATLAVTDDGPGIAQNERDIVFERFKRGTATAGRSGFGLGLAIGRELAHRLSGDLIYSESHTGQGSHFVLTLPIEIPD